MTFDSRARRAAQGIHRAVEVMEMASTKTPQKLTRFDQHRERKSRNQRIMALAVGIAVPVLLVVGALLVIRSNRDGRPAESLPTPSVTPASVDGRSHGFKAPFTYSLPASWTKSGEGARYFSLDATDGSAHLIVLRDVVANASDCSDRPKQGVGTSSDAMTSWLSGSPAFDATTPRPVQLGAAMGSYVDVQLADPIRKNCSNGLGLVTAQPDHPQGWSINAGEKDRVYVLDLPAGGTVTMVVAAFHSSDFQGVIHEATPFVSSIRFRK